MSYQATIIAAAEFCICGTELRIAQASEESIYSIRQYACPTCRKEHILARLAKITHIFYRKKNEVRWREAG